MKLQPTGERLIPNAAAGELVLAEHLARYRLAARLAAGKAVLDAACGEGYGAALLRGAGASAVTAVDIDSATAAHAREHHGVDALEGDVTALPFEEDAFDLVASFETIEHVAEPERALDEFARVLRPDGVLIVSTPNPAEYSEDNPYHLRELTLDEFAAALRARFANVRMLYQQTFLTSAILAASSLRSEDATVDLDLQFSKAAGVEPERALYGVAICSDGPLPDIGSDIAIAAEVYEAHALAALYREWQARATEAERIQAEWEERATTAEGLQREWEGRAVEAERQYRELREVWERTVNSVSWRITKPLRDAGSLRRR